MNVVELARLPRDELERRAQAAGVGASEITAYTNLRLAETVLIRLGETVQDGDPRQAMTALRVQLDRLEHEFAAFRGRVGGVLHRLDETAERARFLAERSLLFRASNRALTPDEVAALSLRSLRGYASAIGIVTTGPEIASLSRSDLLARVAEHLGAGWTQLAEEEHG